MDDGSYRQSLFLIPFILSTIPSASLCLLFSVLSVYSVFNLCSADPVHPVKLLSSPLLSLSPYLGELGVSCDYQKVTHSQATVLVVQQRQPADHQQHRPHY
jgi:hypothetical protein